MRFPTLRLAALLLSLAAQAYLFVRIRQTFRAAAPPRRRLVTLAALVCALLVVVNTVVLFWPIAWVDPPLVVRVVVFYAAAIWSLAALFSGLVLLAIDALHAAGRLVRWCVPDRARGPVDPGRRRLLRLGLGAVVGSPVLLAGYGAAYAGKRYDVRSLPLPFGRAVRVVQLTDIHAGLYMSPREVRRCAIEAAALRPDVLALTGDFISNSTAFLPGCLEELAKVPAPLGAFAILGNHEHMYGRLDALRSTFDKYGIPLLVNEHRIVQAAGDGRFAIAGIDSLQRGAPDLDATLAGIEAEVPVLLLSHYPEIFPEAARRGVALTLSGHWHGGQVTLRLPGRTISFAHARTPYPEGLYRLGDSRLYVGRGIGTTGTPVRLNAPPEITLFQLS